MFQENHSGFLTRFASPYIMRLLKRGGLDYGVRLMKRNEGIPEELSGINMIKRGYNNEEGGRGGRLTSLDASFMRCSGFFQTSSKTSRSMFFSKHR